jgi:hypothetical protein
LALSATVVPGAFAVGDIEKWGVNPWSDNPAQAVSVRILHISNLNLLLIKTDTV